MKIGRNAPCPCGSGKKYKKCCLNKDKQPVDLLWRRLGDAHDHLVNDLTQYLYTALDHFTLPAAIDEFLLWPEEEGLEEFMTDHEPFFFPWLFFNWVYEADDPDMTLNIPTGQTIAEMYARERGKRLDVLQRQLIDATTRQPFSFYEVVSCNPGQGYCLKDIFMGTETDVMEKMGSENAQPGYILLGRIVQVDHVAMLVGCGTIMMPPGMKPSIIELRRLITAENHTITSEVLYDYDFEIRELYLDIFESMSRPPQLQNTDGDPLLFHKLYYDIDDAETAFQKLGELSIMETPAELLEAASLDKQGQIVKVEIPWTRPGYKKSSALDNTILGHLTIDGTKLLVEVNSEARAKTIQKEIKKRLGRSARYKTTEIQSPEAMMKDKPSGEAERPGEGMSHDELIQIPEVREHVENVLMAHWEDWVDHEIPALGGKTPREAVKTPDGRESVEALLLDAQGRKTDDEVMNAVTPKAIARVRHRLGLDKDPTETRKRKTVRGKKEERVEAIKSMIEGFGRSRLDPIYTGFVLKLCDRIARMRKLDIQRGRTEIWAASMVYAIARLNLLFDPKSDSPITTDTLCDYFETKKSTVGNKATLIEQACHLDWGSEDYVHQDIIDTFSFVETPDGFILPKSMFSDPDFNIDIDNEGADLARFSAELKRIQEREAEAGRVPREERSRELADERKKKREADDRQLKLFEDD